MKSLLQLLHMPPLPEVRYGRSSRTPKVPISISPDGLTLTYSSADGTILIKSIDYYMTMYKKTP